MAQLVKNPPAGKEPTLILVQCGKIREGAILYHYDFLMLPLPLHHSAEF